MDYGLVNFDSTPESSDFSVLIGANQYRDAMLHFVPPDGVFIGDACFSVAVVNDINDLML